MKYKLLKDLPGVKAGEIFKIDDTKVRREDGYNSTKYVNSYWLFDAKEWFEEIKEEETPKFKVGDKIVEESKFNNIGICEYIIITSVAKHLNGKYIYNLQYGDSNYYNYLNEDKIRLATPKEIEQYFI